MVDEQGNSPITHETLELHLRRIDKRLTEEKIETNKAYYLWPIALAGSFTGSAVGLWPKPEFWALIAIGTLLCVWSLWKIYTYQRKH